MKVTPMKIILSGVVLFLPFLVVSIVLGYSGSDEATEAGSRILLVGFAMAGLVVLAGVFTWLVKVGVQSARD